MVLVHDHPYVFDFFLNADFFLDIRKVDPIVHLESNMFKLPEKSNNLTLSLKRCSCITNIIFYLASIIGWKYYSTSTRTTRKRT